MRIFKEEVYPVFSTAVEDGMIPNVEIGDALTAEELADWYRVNQEYNDWQQRFYALYRRFSVPAEST